MSTATVFSSIAIKELEDSSDWYEKRAAGLGKRFVETIYSTLFLAAQNPEAFSKTTGHHREIIIDGFPYIIVYRYDTKDNIINILHVFHTSRNPKLKYKGK